MSFDEAANLRASMRAVLKSMGRPSRLFALEPPRLALLIVDMQNAFCASGGCIEIPAARSIVPNINRLAARCRAIGAPVIFVGWSLSKSSNRGLWPLFQPASPSGQGAIRPPEALTGHTTETRFYSELHLDRGTDHVVWKRRYSPFAPGSSRLPSLLRRLERDTVLITGVGSNVCCESTARDAMMRDLRVIFVSDANATVSPLLHEVTLFNIQLFFGDVVSTATILRELPPKTAESKHSHGLEDPQQ